MIPTRLAAVLLALAAIAMVTADATAVYHPVLGRFLQRDPGPGADSPTRVGAGGPAVGHRFIPPDPTGGNQYADGMNLYQYVGSNPIMRVDPTGLWGKDLHYDLTVKWAKEVGYTDSGCAEIIGKACNDVDWTFGGTAPRPFIGDMSYHFDYDKDGLTPVPGARQKNVDNHLGNARRLARHAQWAKTTGALKEIGTALHPLQDMYSHRLSHMADSPLHHAPKAYCTIVFQDPGGTRESWCIGQRENNPNWADPHRPDTLSLWAADVAATEAATKKVLKDFLQYAPIRCRCAPGY